MNLAVKHRQSRLDRVPMSGDMATRRCFLAATGAALFASRAVHAEVHPLPNGVDQPEAFPDLIVGLLEKIISDVHSRQLLKIKRAAGHWQFLPDSNTLFDQNVQIVTIRAPQSATAYTVLMSRDEAQAAPLNVGDLVRYAPHHGQHEFPPPDPTGKAFWRITGCVAVLCSATDAMCRKDFSTGVYRHTDGAALTADGMWLDPSRPSIDPQSLRPR